MNKLDTASLVGTWLKQVPAPAGAVAYPARLALHADGQYRGTPDAGRQFTRWDVGSWKLAADGRHLDLTTANDARVRYAVTAWDGQRIALRDPQGCELAYRRA